MASSLTGRMLCGVVAGAAGTLAMDLLWYRRSQQGDGDGSTFLQWELTDADSFDEAGAPAKLGRRVAGIAGIELPESAAGRTNDVVHWLTGVGYGALVQGAVIDGRRNVAASALATGVGAWAMSYGVLGAEGLYKPVWEYDAETLKQDLSAHLVFGAATAVTYRALRALGV